MKRMMATTALIATAMAAMAQTDRKASIAVAPFAPPDVYRTHEWRPISDKLSGMLTNELVNRGHQVLERSSLDQLNNEEIINISQGGVDRIGNKVSADYMIVGTMDVEASTRTIIIVSETKITVHLQARLVEMGTGIIKGVYSADGEDKTNGLHIDGLPGIDGGNASLDKAINRAACKLLKDFPKSLAPVASVTAAAPASSEASASVLMPSLQKGWRYMVLLPETHLARPRIPDPAAETEIKKALINAGLKVYDGPQIAELREQDWVREAMRGTASPIQLRDIANHYGVDVLIAGEAISERSEVGGQPGLVTCRGRVEVKALILATGQLLMADSRNGTGRDLSEIISSKDALREAGLAMGPIVLSGIAKFSGNQPAYSQAASIDLQISGWSKISAAEQFLQTLASIPGVKSAKRREYKGGTLYAEITLEPSAVSDLPIWLESNARLKAYGITVENSSSSAIQGHVGK